MMKRKLSTPPKKIPRRISIRLDVRESILRDRDLVARNVHRDPNARHGQLENNMATAILSITNKMAITKTRSGMLAVE